MNRDLVRTSRAKWVLVTLAIALAPGFAAPDVSAWHSCNKCSAAIAPATDSEHKGGAGDPLYWRSAQRLEHVQTGPMPEYRCYERGVSNASDRSITNVVWKVVNYFKSRVPAKTTLCDAWGVQGSTTEDSGPILYGPSGVSRYETQVWAPQKGWVPEADDKNARFFGSSPPFSQAFGKYLLQLTNGVSFAFVEGEGTGIVSLNSSVESRHPGTYHYTYVITNEGSRDVQVAWGIVTDVPEIRDFRNDYILSVKQSILLQAGRTLAFPMTSKFPPKWGIGKVVVRDEAGRILAEGIASSYGPSSGTIIDPAQVP